MTDRATVGLIGVGNMGAPMAVNIAQGNYDVIAFDARGDVLAAACGMHERVSPADSVADIAAQADVIITMLPDSDVVNRVVFGSGDAPESEVLSPHLRAGSLIIDMSSSFPIATRALAEKLGALDVALVDAPVSGGVGKAKSGTLAIMCGGTDAAVTRAMPILETMGTVFRTGDVGTGHAMKALNNYVSAAGLIATCEALGVGRAFGLEPERMVEILNASTGKNNTTENKVARFMLSGAFDSGFALALMAKDVGMARQLADSLHIEAQELDLVSAYLQSALSKLGHDADHTAVFQVAALSDRTKPAAD